MLGGGEPGAPNTRDAAALNGLLAHALQCDDGMRSAFLAHEGLTGPLTVLKGSSEWPQRWRMGHFELPICSIPTRMVRRS